MLGVPEAINQISYAETISTLAFITALGALAWNIVRDFVTDRVSIELQISFGELGNIKSSQTGLFANAGSLLPEHKFDSPYMLVKVVNTGRKSVCVSGVGGVMKNNENFSMAVEGLPKMLEPYEIFTSSSRAKEDFVEKICNKDIKKIVAIDTKGKKWKLSKKNWETLSSTAEYINSKKHL